MSYRGEQKIKGKTYVYEAVAVWNPEKKRSEQKRIYIGTRDPETGDFIPNRKYELLEQAEQEGRSREEAVQELLAAKSRRSSKKDKAAAAPAKDADRTSVPAPRQMTAAKKRPNEEEKPIPADNTQEKTVSETAGQQTDVRTRKTCPSALTAAEYGRSCALRQIAEGCGLTAILKNCFPAVWEEILEFTVTGAGPLPRIDEEDAEDFFLAWTERCGDKTYRSFYSGLRHFYPDSADVLAAGSRDNMPGSARQNNTRQAAGAGTPQMTVLVGAESGLPVYYRFEESAVPAMQDLITGFAFLKPLDLLQVCFCFPESLYTDRGLYLLLQHDIRFIVRMPLSAIPAASLLKGYDPEQAGNDDEVLLNGRTCRIRSGKTVINGRHVRCHLCCDIQSRRLARANLLHHICALEEKVTSGRLQTTDTAVRRYLTFEKKAGEGWVCRRKEEVIREELKYAGCFILLSNGVEDSLPVLQSALFQTDFAKIADRPGTLSDYMSADPELRGEDPWNPEAVSSKVFCSFLQLILHARIRNLLLSKADPASPEESGPESLLAELAEIRRIRFDDGTTVVTRLTERQKQICEALSVEIHQD